MPLDLTDTPSNLTDMILNPLTPMAFLKPAAGYQATIAAYVMVGSVAVSLLLHAMDVVEDWCSNCDIFPFKLPNCQVLEKAICAFYHITFASTAFLFFLRVRAVFKKNKYVVTFFALLWLAVLGTSLTAATVASAIHLGPTNYCVNSKLKPSASAAPIAFAINDTFVFLAISWQLLSSGTVCRGRKSTIKSMILGEYLPVFTRAMLQEGQVYYLLREDTTPTQWIASQLGHLDLEVGRQRVKSPIHFLSFRTTENETDDAEADWGGRPLRETNTVITGQEKKDTDRASTEKTEP
ncbi:hypothetical protein C0992_008741 [Termitomyces sp. T32_za158]|nr:hypothetical protein C0992_008741 [Termitomyces sp. T32_za158]